MMKTTSTQPLELSSPPVPTIVTNPISDARNPLPALQLFIPQAPIQNPHFGPASSFSTRISDEECGTGQNARPAAQSNTPLPGIERCQFAQSKTRSASSTVGEHRGDFNDRVKAQNAVYGRFPCPRDIGLVTRQPTDGLNYT
jgi:hypothetical protein